MSETGAEWDPRVIAAVITVAATLGSFGLNALFTHVWLPRRAANQKRQETIGRFARPLARAVQSNVVYLRTFIRFKENGWFGSQSDDYFRLAMLYTIAEFFAWWQLIEDYAYLEFSEPGSTGESLNRRGLRVYRNFNSFIYHSASGVDTSRIKELTVPRRVSQAIGELMVSDSDTNLGPTSKGVIGFAEFTERYKTDRSLKEWLKYVERLFLTAEGKGGEAELAIERLQLLLSSFEIFKNDLDLLFDLPGEHRIRIELKQTDSVRDEVLSEFLYAYKDYPFEVVSKGMSSRDVTTHREEQLSLPLPSRA